MDIYVEFDIISHKHKHIICRDSISSTVQDIVHGELDLLTISPPGHRDQKHFACD